MKHLIFSREYPPAPSGGIGTYTSNIVQQLVERGETVHVIGQLWQGAEQTRVTQCGGRWVIHRVPLQDWEESGCQPRADLPSGEARALFASPLWAQSFAWQAGELAEQLIEQEGIDVVEAPDYEAPLYYLQLRRALGLGPAREPPLIVHLHSPTELIAHYDDWDPGRADVVTARRLEHYSLRAADAVLCPSRFLMEQAVSRYGIERTSVEVIPYPMGDVDHVDRDPKTWKQGSICYVGRLERRKGVIEWIQAAVAAATQDSELIFEFIGANVLGTARMKVDELARILVPAELQRRFVFHGQRERAEIVSLLRGARMAVVPSRWDNFPHTCIEAMASGLPIIASPHGGMAEMIEDGRTGWLADSASSYDLYRALRRAVATPPEQLALMGSQSSETIRRVCDNRKVVTRQLDFRRALSDRGADRSRRLPRDLSRSGEVPTGGKPPEPREEGKSSGIVIIVCATGSRNALRSSLESLDVQERAPAAVILVGPDWLQDQIQTVGSSIARVGARFVRADGTNLAMMKNRAMDDVAARGIDPLGYAFLRPGDRLDSRFLACCEDGLRRLPEVGIVSVWTQSRNTGAVNTRTFPAYPFQLLRNEVSSPSVVRATALHAAGHFEPTLDEGYEEWDRWNAIFSAGWAGVTYPAILAFCDDEAHQAGGLSGQPSQRFRQRILERNRKELSCFSNELLGLLDLEGGRWNQPILDSWGQAAPDNAPGRSSQRARSLLRKAAGPGGRRLIRKLLASLRAFGSSELP